MTETAPHLSTASHARRLAACLIDLVLCGLPAAAVEEAAEWLTSRWEEPAAAVAGFLYFWLLHARYGQTVGKRLLRLKVISPETGLPPSFQAAAYRAAFYTVITLTPALGPLIAAMDGLHVFLNDRRQCFHDMLAGTIVVRVP